MKTLYNTPDFLNAIAEDLFKTLDTDKSGTVDFPELIIGLSVLTSGDKAQTAKRSDFLFSFLIYFSEIQSDRYKQ